MSNTPHEIEQSFELWLRLHVSTQKAVRREGAAGVPSVLERYKVSRAQWERASARWWEMLREDRQGGGSRRLRLFEQAMVRLEEQGTRTVTPFAGDKTGMIVPDAAGALGEPTEEGPTRAQAPRHPSPLPFAAQGGRALPFRQEAERIDPVVMEAHPALGGTAKGEISPLFRRKATPFESKAPASAPAVPASVPPAVPASVPPVVPASVPPAVPSSPPVPHGPPGPAAPDAELDEAAEDAADEAAIEAALAADDAAPPTPVSDEEVVEDLRRLGANDDYIARVLARRAGGGGG